MILNISLISIFICFAFIVTCSILHRIEIHPLTKGVLCISMLTIIGCLARNSHGYINEVFTAFIAFIAGLIIGQTFVAYKRGYL